MIIINLISFVLEGILSALIDKNSLFVPLFSLVSLILVFPYINKTEKFVLCGAVIGLLYDLVYTQTLFLNTIVFTILSSLILLFFKYFPTSQINSIILNFLLIVLFRLIIFTVQVVVGNIDLNFNILFTSIYTSLISNMIYLILMTLILKKLKKSSKKNFMYK